MQILNKSKYNKKIPKGATFTIKIDDLSILEHKITCDMFVEQVAVFGELFTKQEDMCIGGIMGTKKSIKKFEKLIER